MLRNKAWIAAVLVAVMASACSGQKSQTGTESPSSPKSENKTPVELVLYSTAATSEEEVKQKFSGPIEKQFPHIKIKYIKKAEGTNINELIAAGQTIDIYYESVNFFNTVTTYQLGYDMTDLIKTHSIDLNAFEGSMIDYARAMSAKGIYGLPAWTENVILFYNKDLFDKFGVSYPKNGMTWDDLAELAKKMTRNDGGRQYMGFAASPSHVLRANQFGLTFLDPKTDKATINADPRWKQIFDAYFVQPSNNTGFKDYMTNSLKSKLPYKDPFLKDQNLAMLAYLSQLDWAASGPAGMNWDIAALPTFKSSPNVGSSAYPFYWGVTAQSKHKDDGMDVIKFLTSKEYQTMQARSGTMTTLKDDSIKKQLAQDSKHKDKNISAIFYNQYAPMPKKSAFEGDAQKSYEDAVHEAALGNTDINTLFRKIEEGANKAVDEAKIKK
ncbi:MAG: extracellular solute-binding protein family 1 [Paenibacillus sp.]|jgi:multiple sugar transport system substrate-binding protein|nr:extracellular solute-binding protein family 1 [Paenibacillus sp.]